MARRTPAGYAVRLPTIAALADVCGGRHHHPCARHHANSAIFALVDATPSPAAFREPDCLVMALERTEKSPCSGVSPASEGLNERREPLKSGRIPNVGGVAHGRPTSAEMCRANGLGPSPKSWVCAHRRRTFLQPGQRAARFRAKLLRTRFNGYRSLIGRTIGSTEALHRAGVMPPEARLLATAVSGPRPCPRSQHYLRADRRMKPGVPSRPRGPRASPQPRARFPIPTRTRRSGSPTRRVDRQRTAPHLLLFSPLGFSLADLPANVANLLLARATVRTRSWRCAQR